MGLSLGLLYLAGLNVGAFQGKPSDRLETASGATTSWKMDAATPALRVDVSGPSPAERPAAVAAVTAGARGNRDLDCLAQAVYFEARGESPAGQAAVAQVVLNRVRKAGFPKSVCGVVFQGSARGAGCQFSFACDGSMNRGREATAWSVARHIASRALAGAAMTAVGDATHFHTIHVTPGWSDDLLRVTQVGLHVFYRIGQPSPRTALAQATPEPVAEVRAAEARLISGPPSDPVEVVEGAPAPLSETLSEPTASAAQTPAPPAP
ncbi:MAG: cell wall hydrolase [Phenylobacterium sp.]